MVQYIVMQLRKYCFMFRQRRKMLYAQATKRFAYQEINKTMEYISQVYRFPFTKDKIQKNISNCLKCITFTTTANQVKRQISLWCTSYRSLWTAATNETSSKIYTGGCQFGIRTSFYKQKNYWKQKFGVLETVN